MFESVDAQTDAETPAQSHTVSSLRAFGSGELKILYFFYLHQARAIKNAFNHDMGLVARKPVFSTGTSS